ncbi:MAG: flagellar export chaperone FliS [Firmicutes bacterium]|nr:flagellar export chaperone FliS [Bacillota bacterium]
MANPYEKYREVQVLTASPERLVLLLYEGAIRFLEEARAALDGGDLAKAHERLTRTQDILTELITGLDFNYEVSSNLYRLYDYFRRRLVEANVRKDPGAVQEVLRFLKELRDTWREAVVSRKAGESIESKG